jgi:ABC-type transport system involved in multi-copper enzyme maturation permease subunit
VTGHGDIAPSVPGGEGDGTPISQTLDGAFAGLIAAIVVAAMFFTAEYRRGLIQTTLAARPARGQVLAAKAVVIGAVTFAGALIGCAIAVPVADHLLRGNGNVVDPVPLLTWLRVVIGTAAVFALAAVLALGLGAIFRHGATAVTAAIVLVILPYIMAVASPALPATAADWLLRISPTAALAIQQTIPQYPQVVNTYLPFFGFFPLPAWAGFVVLVAWTAAILLLAARLLGRRDA